MRLRGVQAGIHAGSSKISGGEAQISGVFALYVVDHLAELAHPLELFT